MHENEIKQPKHLLLIRLSALGDVAMTVPVVLALRQQYPSLKITVVSKSLFRHFFTNIPEIGFYGVDFKDDNKGLLSLYDISKKLTKLGADTFADLHNVLRTKVIKQFFKGKSLLVASLDKGRHERKQLTALKQKNISPIKSIFSCHSEVCARLNLPIDLTKVSLLEKCPLSNKIIEITGSKSSPWIGIAPFAAYNTKVYALESMQKVIQLLTKEGYIVLLFGGGAEEIKKLELLAADSDNCKNIAGKLSIDEELALISNLDLMLSMDSGNGHMAAMYDIPVITMWGNTHPYAGFIPFGQPIENSLIPDLDKFPFIPTSIYGNKVVPGYEDCMKTIQPTEVVAKINMALSNL